MKYKIAVVGAGSAGLQSACSLLYKLDARWEVHLIHDPSIKTLGHIESTNPGFVSALAFGADFDVIQDAEALDCKLKFGTKYRKWRTHEFVNPLVTGIAAMNFDTAHMHDFVIPRMKKAGDFKFKEIHGTVSKIEDRKNYATVTIDGIESQYNFIIDCRGFSNPDQNEEDIVRLDHVVNICFVYMKDSPIDSQYTGHVATKDGWMWEIPLLTRTNYGYLYNDKITDPETAKKNFSEEIGVPLDQLECKEYKFISKYNKRIFGNRVIKNGLSAAFIEPMFSNGLWMYDNIDGHIMNYIHSYRTIDEIKSEQEIEHYNKLALHNMREVEDMLYFCYHGGSTINSSFWKHAKKYATERLGKSENLKRVKPILRDMTKNKHRVGNAVWFYGPLNLIRIDKNFGYNYFTE